MIHWCPTPFVHGRPTPSTHGVPRVSYTGDNFASTSSVLNEWLFREMPNSRSCDEFPERLLFVLFTLRDPELIAVYNATADV